MGQLSSQVAAARETFAEFADEASDYASNVATAVRTAPLPPPPFLHGFDC